MSIAYHRAATNLGAALGLSRLPDHLPFIVLGASVFTTIQLLSPLIFRRLLPEHYPKLSRKTQRAWDVHFVAFAHALYATPVAAYLLVHREQHPAITASPIMGYDPLLSDICAFSAGYFVWDFFISTFNIGGSGGPGFILHAVGCLTAFMNAFRPFALYYLPVFLLWEASSIFLNIHWALDKVGRTGGRLQYVNGVILLVTFFAVRILFGFYSTYQFFIDLQNTTVKALTPASLRNVYKVANVALDLLNVYWFKQARCAVLRVIPELTQLQMIASVRKRFAKAPSQKKRA